MNQILWCLLIWHDDTILKLGMAFMLLEYISRVLRKAKDDEQDEDEPSTFRKVLYSYMAFILLQAEFSTVINRISSIKREKHTILRRLMIARKFQNSPSIFVAAQPNPRRRLGSCDLKKLYSRNFKKMGNRN